MEIQRRRGLRAATSIVTGAMLLVASGTTAVATSYTLKSATYGWWTTYSQQRDNWCWAATTQAVIKKIKGKDVNQCNIVNWGLATTGCPDEGGVAFTDYRRALSKAGLSSTGTQYGTPSWSLAKGEASGFGVLLSLKLSPKVSHSSILINTDTTPAGTNRVLMVKVGTTSVSNNWVAYSDFTAGKAGQSSTYTINASLAGMRS